MATPFRHKLFVRLLIVATLIIDGCSIATSFLVEDDIPEAVSEWIALDALATNEGHLKLIDTILPTLAIIMLVMLVIGLVGAWLGRRWGAWPILLVAAGSLLHDGLLFRTWAIVDTFESSLSDLSCLLLGAIVMWCLFQPVPAEQSHHQSPQ